MKYISKIEIAAWILTVAIPVVGYGPVLTWLISRR